jgi:hypothetical protein
MAEPKRQVRGEVRAKSEERRLSVLEGLGSAIATRRKDAIDGRLSSGIEKIWTEDDEHYQGYDNANRHEFGEVAHKPSESGASSDPPKASGSTLFPPLTGRYVDAAAAKVADMLLPTDDRNFVIEPTPVPDVLDEEEGWPEIVPEVAQPGLMAQGAGGPAAMLPQPATPAAGIMADPAAAAGTTDPEAELKAFFDKLKEIRARAEASAKAEQDQIDDWLVECSYHTELRRVIDDCSRIGTGVIKGPVPEKREIRVWAKNKDTGERELVKKTKTMPASRRVSAWDCFPDYPACGEDIQRGSFFLEREFFSGKMLRALKGGTGPAKYLDPQIDKVLKEGPAKRNSSAGRGFEQMGDDKDVFELWRYYGVITGEQLEAAGCECENPEEEFDVIVTLINDTVIKASLNPLASGEFPFDMMPWQARPGMPWGTGVGRQGRTAQRITTAGLRNLMDNAGASSKPHKVITGDIEQAENPWTWRPTSDAPLGDVRSAMMFFVQPSLQAELMNIIQLGERRFEVDTGLPMIILGMQGNVQETAHGRALQNNNGATVLRRIARYFDALTESHIRRYHEWVLVYGEDDAMKGDFQIQALGSSALVERDLQNQQMPVILNASLQPSYGLDPVLAMEEYLKSQKFSPESFQLTDERKKELASQTPPPPPQIAVAEIKEKGLTERQAAEHAHDQRMEQFRQQFDATQHKADRDLQQAMADLDARLQMADLSSEERQNLEKQKVLLAKVTMELNTQKDLVRQTGPQVATPGTEPPGRAPEGMAFPL